MNAPGRREECVPVIRWVAMSQHAAEHGVRVLATPSLTEGLRVVHLH